MSRTTKKVGGWAAEDVSASPASFYSFSFAPNYEWSSFHPSGPEILRYFHQVCDRYQISDKFQFNTDVTELRWLEAEAVWEAKLIHLIPGTGDLSKQDRERLMTRNGPGSVQIVEEIVRAKIICTCAGGFVEPKSWPAEIPGRDQFEGRILHSAKYDPNVSLEGKDVVVIGSGCSAVQIVPTIRKAPYNARSVTQIMRSPPWVEPRQSPPGGEEKWHKWSSLAFGLIPGLFTAWRAYIFFILEMEFLTIFRMNQRGAQARKRHENYLSKHLERTVPEKYLEILLPNYPVGCKRRVFDSNWLPSLNDPMIELTTRRVTAVRQRSITIGPDRHYPDRDVADSKALVEQQEIPADVIILANGFDMTGWLFPLRVIGKGGAHLWEVWKERGGPQAYMGNTMDGFPNLFIIFGPNTATGHSSVILATENMVKYTLKFIRKILQGDVRTFDVKKEKEVAWTSEIQDQLNKTVFKTGCASWYNDDSGWNSTAYPYVDLSQPCQKNKLTLHRRTQIDFGIRCMFPRWDDFNIQYTRKGLSKLRVRRALKIIFIIFTLCAAFSIRKNVSGGLVKWFSQATKGVRRIMLQLIAATTRSLSD